MAKDARGLSPSSDAGIATAEQGLVLLDGPDGVAIAMTPECAAETASQLAAAAEEARRQQARGSGPPVA